MPTDEAPAAPGNDHGPDMFADAPFPYMRWAKANLPMSDAASMGLSGVPRPACDDVPGLAAQDDGEPEADLRAALALRYGISPDGVHLAAGSSGANFLAYLTFARDAHVAAEIPAYEVLHGLAGIVGAGLSTFVRDPENEWRIDPASLDAAMQSNTRLIVVTDLHNPSGKRLHDEDLALLTAAADAHDAVVLVDEVYLDFDPLDHPSAATKHPRVVTTNSLTKVHGLSELRAGWLLGDPERIRALDLIDDLVNPNPPKLPCRIATGYLAHADALVAKTRAVAAQRCKRVDAWVRATEGVWWVRPDAGITGFLELAPGSDDIAIVDQLYRDHGVRAIPGTFFQRPGWMRISFLLDEDRLETGLHAIATVLRESQ